MTVTKNALLKVPGCFSKTTQLTAAKQNPVYECFSKGGRNKASGKFSDLILDHANDCQLLWTATFDYGFSEKFMHLNYKNTTSESLSLSVSLSVSANDLIIS